MQAVTQNPITQAQHGDSKAVDYDNDPDPIIYAPEDGTIVSYGQQGTPGTTNDAGLALRMNGANGLHQFAHTERSLVAVGQQVKRGQPIAVIGYTGYTQPDNTPAGAHVHWWIKTPSGFVYPPSLINESFKKEKGEPMVTTGDVRNLYPVFLGRAATDADIAVWSGKSFGDFMYGIAQSNEYKQRIKNLNSQTIDKQKVLDYINKNLK